MKAKKILNNNVIVTQNEKVKEIIVMGKGLAFGLKTGETINQSKIDKVFNHNSSLETSRFKELIELVPEEYIEMTESFIDYADEDSLSCYRFIVHLRSFSQRLLTGTMYQDSNDNELLQNIQKKYAESFRCGQLIQNIYLISIIILWKEKNSCT